MFVEMQGQALSSCYAFAGAGASRAPVCGGPGGARLTVLSTLCGANTWNPKVSC